MNVLVLGATSVIGAHVAEAFAPGNDLLLAGRDRARLHQAAERCRAAQAASVVETAMDLREGVANFLAEISGLLPDVIINAASATSRLRDDSIPADELAGVITVDLLAPLELIRSLIAERSGEKTRIVFISSVLASVPSPRRVIYGNLKRMQEESLLALARSNSAVQVLIARLAKPIPPDQPSRDAIRFAAAVRHAFDKGETKMSFGLSGRLMNGLFWLQPAVFHIAVEFIRLIRSQRRPTGSSMDESTISSKNPGTFPYSGEKNP
ncbi:MAG TPA: SDR family oxidoreductase [Bryobacteraceae bacterium]|nr:SDR family oxidoreductase [Bryobacteraceae bacterium]